MRAETVGLGVLKRSLKMDLTPIELYLSLVFVLPVGVCFWKWKKSSKWVVAITMCAALSWAYFNLWMFVLDPPDNGFANFVYLVTGWFWLLPVFGIFWTLFRFSERFLAEDTQRKIGSVGFFSSAVVSAIVVFWSVFGRMSEQRAIVEARARLEEFGYKSTGKEIPEFVRGHWIVRYPETDFGEIRLTRNGGMSWIGGPG